MQKENRKLPVLLTEEEISHRGRELAKTQEDIANLEEEKKAFVADVRGKVKTRREIVRVLSRQVASGTEIRNVECEVIKDFERGIATITRTDTGEVVQERPLTIEERQETLFKGNPVEPKTTAKDKPAKGKKASKGNSFYDGIDDEPASEESGD